mmetsp:Transcript_31177/g.73628  ORF Transcript_31177/g.73628 Transcript_31177/m.73628 type:complete len:212 (+) Transcript_31177:1631-2266(+)
MVGEMRCSARRALDWIWIGPPYGAYEDACSKIATFMPSAWQAEAVTRPARPPPVMSTVSGSSFVTGRPPLGVSRCVRHQALASSSPTSMPRSSTASAAACSKRPLIRSVRSWFSATRFGASGCARISLTCSGMSTLFRAAPSPLASHSTCGSSSLSLRITAAGPNDCACWPTTIATGLAAARCEPAAGGACRPGRKASECPPSRRHATMVV